MVLSSLCTRSLSLSLCDKANTFRHSHKPARACMYITAPRYRNLAGCRLVTRARSHQPERICASSVFWIARRAAMLCTLNTPPERNSAERQRLRSAIKVIFRLDTYRQQHKHTNTQHNTQQHHPPPRGGSDAQASQNMYEHLSAQLSDSSLRASSDWESRAQEKIPLFSAHSTHMHSPRQKTPHGKHMGKLSSAHRASPCRA